MSAKAKPFPAARRGPLEKQIADYFEACREGEVPASPAGLAEALGLSTDELLTPSPIPRRRQLIGHALQRIEAELMARALGPKGSAKAIDIALEQIRGAARVDELGALTEEELNRRLASVADAIRAALEEGGGKAPPAPRDAGE